MKTYLLFLTSDFSDFEDVEFFCVNVFSENDEISNVKYIIQNLHNLIIIFESSAEHKKLKKEIQSLLDNDNTTFYFLFEKNSLLASYIPDNLKEIIYKINSDSNSEEEVLHTTNFDLNTILEKINKAGIESLTKDEKKYLDNFKS